MAKIQIKHLFLLVFILFSAGCSSGLRDSDPQLIGERDMNYDRLIIAGERIGPVRLGGFVSDAVKHLGNPDRVYRSTFRGPGYNADEVYYYYNDECIKFVWQDSGLNPRIETGWRGITVTCDKWHTPEGLRVGIPIRSVPDYIPDSYCPVNDDDFVILYKRGIWFRATNRSSPVTVIDIVPSSDSWEGSCKD